MTIQRIDFVFTELFGADWTPKETRGILSGWGLGGGVNKSDSPFEWAGELQKAEKGQLLWIWARSSRHPALPAGYPSTLFSSLLSAG